MSASSRAALRAPAHEQGTTRLLQTMIDSATVSTITMAVEADRPPRKAIRAKQLAAGGNRQGQHDRVSPSVVPRAKNSEPGDGDRHDENVDRDEIERKQPGGAVRDRRAAAFSTTATWNWRGSSTMANTASKVMVSQRPPSRPLREEVCDLPALPRQPS